MNEDNPNPDELLRAIQEQEKKKGLGSLKIFFGMSAGVGKTYAMLEDAQQRLKDGVNVVVGTINTHGRKETEELLQGLPIIPEKWVKYKDTVFEEMDIETILYSKPALVLIDELAHTNVPGSKHPKRWQDVIEILDNGIDVYTTLNVQHIESRKDLVESLTGIQIRETVPDLLLERASSLALIDLPPPELLRRLKEGKVYIQDQSRIAAEHFFQEGNLMALREIALRFTAEKVDHDLHGMLQGRGWKTRERLMVAISSSPSSEQLIRSARRLAFELDAPWIAVYIDTGAPLNDQDQARLNRHLNLARELGAEVVTTHDLNISDALQRIAKQRDITRIIIGRPPKKRPYWNIFQRSFIDLVENENKQMDIIILRQEKLTSLYQKTVSQNSIQKQWKAYALTFLYISALTAFNAILTFFIGDQSVGIVFLLGILILSFFMHRGPILFAVILSTIAWALFFLPPLTPFTVTEPEDIAELFLYFIVAILMGTVTSRLYEQDQFLHQREEKYEKLYEIEREISNASNFQSLRLNICSRLENSFPGKFDILVQGVEQGLIFDSQLPELKSDKEKAIANWVFTNGKVGGWSTDTLPSSEALYFPIKFSKKTLGVLVYVPKRDRSLSIEEMNFVQTVNQQLGIYLEKSLFEAKVASQDYSNQIERIHKSLFNSVNRSFQEPLDKVKNLSHQMQEECKDANVVDLSRQIDLNISNIKVTVDNIITLSELESGFVHFEPKKHTLQELIEISIEEVKPFMNKHVIKFDPPKEDLFVSFDLNLLKLALNNLLLNAINHSHASKPILITHKILENEFRLSVVDEGPWISEEIVPLLFDKFYRSLGATHGLGLGLAIVKAVVDIHHGKIEVKNREVIGKEFSIILPI